MDTAENPYFSHTNHTKNHHLHTAIHRSDIVKVVEQLVLVVLLQLSSNYILFRIFKGFGDFSEALFLSCNSSTYIRDNILTT